MRAECISVPTQLAEKNVTFLARKRFFVAAGEIAAFCEADLEVAANARYVAYLNGERIGAGPARSSARRNFKDRWSITGKLLEGENILAFEVHSPMVPTFVSASSRPALWVQWGERIATGSDWEVIRDPSRRSDGSLYTFQTGFAEWRDLRKLPAGWLTGSDHLCWQGALVLSDDEAMEGRCLVDRDIPHLHERWIPAGKVVAYGGVDGALVTHEDLLDEVDFASRVHHEIHFQEVYPRVSTEGGRVTIEPSEVARGCYCVFDFEEVVVGNVEIDLEGPEGVIIDIAYAEALDGVRILPKRYTYSMADRVIHAGGRAVIDLALHDRGWRYLQLVVRGLSEPVVIHRLRGRDRRYLDSVAGAFESSDPALNQLWKMGEQTISACAMDTIVDCPWREQALWLNDLLVVAALYLRLTGDRHLIARCLRMGMDGQRADGLIGAVPPFDGEYFFTLPAIMSVVLRDYYEYTGDRSLVDELLPGLLVALENYRNWREPDGLISAPPDIPHFVDWGYHQDFAIPEGKNAILNLLAAAGCQSAAVLLRAQGEGTQAAEWERESQSLAQTVEEVFWEDEAGRFMDCIDPRTGGPLGSQHTLAIALCFDLLSPERREAALAALNDPALVEAEFYYQYFVLQALSRNGAEQNAFSEVKRLWGPMLEAGSVTIWEMKLGRSVMSGCGSLCHAFSCAPLALMQDVALGIRPLEAGFRRFQVSPGKLHLTSCRGAVPTPDGLIKLDWRCTDGGGIVVNLEVPEGSVAVLPGAAEYGGGRYSFATDEQFAALELIEASAYSGDAEVLHKASWIASSIVGGGRTTAPSPFFRKRFHLVSRPRKAILHVTALGLFECELNGRLVGDDVLAPGWTDFSKSLYVHSYEVTDLLQAGENAIGAILGDGWYCSFIAWQDRQLYGDRPRLRLSLQITDEEGASYEIATDHSWRTTVGPILESDLLMGEAYDARRELDGWSTPDYDDSGWDDALLLPPAQEPRLLPRGEAPPVRRMQQISPVSTTMLDIWTGPVLQVDFGQNFAGRVRIEIAGEAGRLIRIRHGEVLDAEGNLYTDNLRTARAEDSYVTRGSEGDSPEVWEPRFTYHGFRYVEISGLKKGETMTVTGIVLHSAIAETGTFSCSNPLLNQLQSNIVWSQRSNFFEVPTDCPQRDERLGWTGDAQIFVQAAAFNRDVRAFFRKWMRDVRDAQCASGGVPCIAPSLSIEKIFDDDGGPGWSDAMVICPWVIYQCYGDLEILRENYSAMLRYVDFLIRERSIDYIRAHPEAKGWKGYGDWLAQDGSNDQKGATPADLIGTAFLAHVVGIISRIAEILGYHDDHQHYRRLYTCVVDAYRERFLTEGEGAYATQTALVLTLHFDLAPPEMHGKLMQSLTDQIIAGGYGLRTGFIGTPYLLHVLEKHGRTDIAYRLLENEEFPSWLFPVTQGATTIWERLDSFTLEGGFGAKQMNSFNHYAFGAVGTWLYQYVAGIGLDEARPGYEVVVFRPRPGGSLTWAAASLKTAYGEAAIRWERVGDQLEVTLQVPENGEGRFEPPAAYAMEAPLTLSPGRHHFSLPWVAAPMAEACMNHAG